MQGTPTPEAPKSEGSQGSKTSSGGGAAGLSGSGGGEEVVRRLEAVVVTDGWEEEGEAGWGEGGDTWEEDGDGWAALEEPLQPEKVGGGEDWGGVLGGGSKTHGAFSTAAPAPVTTPSWDTDWGEVCS